MICIEALNTHISNAREEENIKIKGKFVIVKLKEKALTMGPLKRFTLLLWYVTKSERFNLVNFILLKRSMNDESDNRAWDKLETKLVLYIFKFLLDSHSWNSCVLQGNQCETPQIIEEDDDGN